MLNNQALKFLESMQRGVYSGNLLSLLFNSKTVLEVHDDSLGNCN